MKIHKKWGGGGFTALLVKCFAVGAMVMPMQLSATEIIVNDSPYVGDITISAGDELKVYGDGLTAATKIWLKGGTMNVYADVAIRSSITQDVSSVVKVESGCKATFLGKVTIKNVADTQNRMSTYGDVVFAGGVNCGTKWDQLFAFSGTVSILTNNCTISGSCGILDTGAATRFTISDGATVTLKDGQKVLPSRIQGTASPVLEISDGGTLEITAADHSFYLGGSSPATMLIKDGGKFSMRTAYGYFFLAHKSDNNPTIDLRSGGVFETRSPIIRYMSTNGDWHRNIWHFNWNGGTLRPLRAFQSSSWMKGIFCQNNGLTDHYKSSYDAVNNSNFLGFDFNILGSDCVLDLTELHNVEPNSVITNALACNFRTGEAMYGGGFYGASSACLTVRGGAMAFNHFKPNGMKLKLESGAKVVFPSVTNTWVFSEIEIAATNASVVVDDISDGAKVGVGTVTVDAAGEWVTGEKIVADSIEITNMTFAANSLWTIPVANGVTPSLSLLGSLTFPSSLRYSQRGLGKIAQSRVISAANPIVGNPEWTRFNGDGKIFFAIRERDVDLVVPGLVLTIR